jgi:hypothetical protein
MSKGPGRIERWVADAIARERRDLPVLVSSWSITFEYQDYSRGWNYQWMPSRAQRQAVVRAMHSFVRKHQQYALIGGKGRKPLYLYEPDDPRSAMWAKLSVERRGFVPFCQVELE